MRILGITKVVVRASLIIEPFMLSFIGAIIGFVIFKLLWKSSGLVPDSSLLLGASLYLAGVLAGSVAGAISVTNKKPMELLQVKE
jgi:ABC-type antimicrobial peptide transport system permease subunit